MAIRYGETSNYLRRGPGPFADMVCFPVRGDDRYGRPATGYEVDATPETKALYDAYEAERVAKAKAAEMTRRAAEASAKAAAEASTPRKGRLVVVSRGRKVPRGTTGESIWYGPGKAFGYGPAPMRVGVKTSDGTVYWTDAKNVDVVAAATEAKAA